jgi:hypothetical protein
VIVVSDTSPLLNLARIRRLEFLSALYGRVLIPPAVLTELKANAGSIPEWAEVVSALQSWLVSTGGEGCLQITEFQRPHVWRAGRASKLVGFLYHSSSISLLLV